MTNQAKIKAIQRTLNREPHSANLVVDGIKGPKTDLAYNALGFPESGSGKGSWYSQHVGEYTWVDKGDTPGSSALGVPDDEQGCAFYNQATLGKWFNVTAPNGRTLRLQQTDIGPHPDTGRSIDIAAVAAEAFGYTPKNFPTDKVFSWEPA